MTSQFDAADRIGVSMVRIGFLVQSGHLEPVHNAAGQAGVSRETVERETAHRADAGPIRRAWLLLAVAGRSFARSV